MRRVILGVVLVAVGATGAVTFLRAGFRAGGRFILEETTVIQVHAALQAGQVSCRSLVVRYFERMDAYDRQGPRLNAIIARNPRALAEAEELDRRLARGGLVGPLHCVPLIVKDNLDTAGLPTTAGSPVFESFLPERDAAVIARLKRAGAIVLAKGNMAEFGLSPLTTINSIHGVTKNPYALERVPAGSSGGTAAAVAANFGLAGIGTDTGSSVRGPAAHNSLVGLRPTMGLTSRAGMVPLNYLSDTVGPMARSVEDLVAVLQVMAGPDPEDPATEVLRSRVIPDYTAALAPDPRGRRVGVFRQAFQGGPLNIDEEIARVFARALTDLRSLGVEIVDGVLVEQPPPAPLAEQCRGLKYDLNEYLARLGPRAPVKSLSDIIASGRFHPSVRDDLLLYEHSVQLGPESEACRANAAYRRAMAEAVTAAMDRQQLDALVYPTWSQPPQLATSIDPVHSGQTLMFATVTGFPAMTVPMGFIREVLPAGMSLMGRAWSEPTLIRLAFAYEQATRHRRPPITSPPIH